MLEVKNLVKNYGKFNVLKGISFSIAKGKVYGFLGQNGAGKSTTMNIIAGLIGYDSGEITLDGYAFNKSKRNLLKKIGYLPQSPKFYGYMNAIEYLNFIGQLSGMNTSQINKRTDEILEIVDLKSAAKRKIGGYSGGMKQRFGLAVSMFNKPEILILDEPTSALDPEGRMDMLNLILNLKENGTTVFLSSHILSDIERICDEVSILHNGRILLSEELSKLKDSYIKPIFDIEFEHDCDKISDIIKKCPYVEAVENKSTKISVHVKDVESTKNELLKLISSFNNPVTSYTLRKSTLEDIFIKLVNKDVNI